MSHRAGDKVLIKSGEHTGKRARVISISGDRIKLEVSGEGLDGGSRDVLSRFEIVNYSLAARKAWLKMPRRRVGRPKGTRVCDRVSVTLRIDRDLWEEFTRAEADGLIDDRTQAINGILKDYLSTVDGGRRNLRPRLISG
jgi:uncharacterized protein (DUF4415 family)